MKRKFTVFGFVMLFLPALVTAQVSDPVPSNAARISRRMFVDPSSTWVSLGKVSLIVSPLTLKGNFTLRITRTQGRALFFKKREGHHGIGCVRPMVRKLLKGTTATFTGKATNTKNGRIKVVTGKTTPSANDRGSVTFSIVTENGPMVFNSFYHFWD